AERAAVLARSPDVDLTIHQQKRHGQTVSADGFGKADDIGNDTGLIEGEECSGTPAPGLNVVDNQQNSAAIAQGSKLPEKFVRGYINSALRLHGFENERGRFVHTRVRIRERVFDVLDGARERARAIGEWKHRDVPQRKTSGLTVIAP